MPRAASRAPSGAASHGAPTLPDPTAVSHRIGSNRHFTPAEPDQLWVADSRYLRCWDGLVFFAFVIDVWSRKVIGWQFAPHRRTDLVLDALRMALAQRRAGADVALVHHSDAGSRARFNRSSQHRLCRRIVDVGWSTTT